MAFSGGEILGPPLADTRLEALGPQWIDDEFWQLVAWLGRLQPAQRVAEADVTPVDCLLPDRFQHDLTNQGLIPFPSPHKLTSPRECPIIGG